MKHSNIAIFVPHNGCPHQCSFCNQKSIVGQAYQPTPSDVDKTISSAIEYLGDNCKNAEVAFFGGSFTAIDREYMVSLLEATVPYIDRIKGIRISTRPDCIDEKVLTLLKNYNVTSIELGAQSMNDTVLLYNNRGHNCSDVYHASKLIKEYDFSLGLQMMTGLYMSNDEIDLDTAREFISIKPDTVRIYPTVVMKNTVLDDLYIKELYKPQSLSDAVSLCSKLILMFEQSNIKVIRVGLHHSESLDTDMVAGPYHPSFKELCESEILYNKLIDLLKQTDTSHVVNVKVAPACISKIIGNKKSNIKRLEESGYKINIIQDKSVRNMEIILDVQRG